MYYFLIYNNNEEMYIFKIDFMSSAKKYEFFNCVTFLLNKWYIGIIGFSIYW